MRCHVVDQVQLGNNSQIEFNEAQNRLTQKPHKNKAKIGRIYSLDFFQLRVFVCIERKKDNDEESQDSDQSNTMAIATRTCSMTNVSKTLSAAKQRKHIL